MPNLVPIELQPNQKKDQKNKLSRGRINYVDKDLVVQNENTILTYKLLVMLFDYETFKKTQGKNTGGTSKQTLLKTARQFYQEVIEIVSEEDKRRIDYLVTNLHNPDGSPIAREDNRIEEFTLIFRALLLRGLKHRTIDRKYRTNRNWLANFGFINYELLNHMIDYTKKIKTGEDENGKEYYRNKLAITLKEQVFTKEVEKVHYIDIPNNLLTTHALSDNEMCNLFIQFADKLISLLNDQFTAALKKLEADGLLEVDSTMLGMLGEPFINHKGRNDFREIKEIELTLLEKHALADLEIKIKEELGLDGITGYKLYRNKEFNKHLEKHLKNVGLVTEKSERKFSRVYKAHSIIKKFTNKELDTYLENNTKIKEYYFQDLSQQINKYEFIMLDKTYKSYDSKEKKRIEKIKQDYENLKNNHRIGVEIDRIEEIQAKITNQSVYTKILKEATQYLLFDYYKNDLKRRLFHDNLKHEAPIKKINLHTINKSLDIEYDFNTLPF